MKNVLLIAGTILLAALAAALLQSPAAAQSKPTEAKPYTEIFFDEQHSDPKAVNIVKKLMAKDIAEMEKTGPLKADVFAQFISLSPDQPATAIAVKIQHPYVCGSSGCQTYIFQQTKSNTYKIVFDTTLGRLFYNQREGQKYYDLLAYVMPRQVEGFGVHFWNAEKGLYEFAGISRFKK